MHSQHAKQQCRINERLDVQLISTNLAISKATILDSRILSPEDQTFQKNFFPNLMFPTKKKVMKNLYVPFVKSKSIYQSITAHTYRSALKKQKMFTIFVAHVTCANVLQQMSISRSAFYCRKG